MQNPTAADQGEMLPGDVRQFAAIAVDAFGNTTPATITWESTIDSVATISPSGEVTAIAFGQTSIIANVAEADLLNRHDLGPVVPAVRGVAVGVPAIGMKFLWQIRTGKSIREAPSVGPDGNIFFWGSNLFETHGSLYAANSDGVQLWSLRLGQFGTSAVVTSTNEVFVASEGTVYSVSGSGVLKWSVFTGTATESGSIHGTPALSRDGTLYAADTRGMLTAISPSGSLLWQHFLPGGVFQSAPAIDTDGKVYVGASCLHAIRPDGTEDWHYCTGAGISSSSPSIGADHAVYFGSPDGYVYCLNRDGTLRWRYLVGNVMGGSSPAIGDDGAIYLGASGTAGTRSGMYALNSDGTLRWFFRTAPVTSSSPALAADGAVYFGSSDGIIYALNRDGTLRWSFATNGGIEASPVLDGHRLYIGSNDGSLYAFRVIGGESTSGPWPQFHRNSRHAGSAQSP
jgi:outer membrane protein assembly factor BamB